MTTPAVQPSLTVPGTWLTWGIDQVGAIGEQASQGLNELGQGFGELLSLAQSGDSKSAGITAATQLAKAAATPGNDPATGLETGVLSSLGLSAAAGSSDPLATMQQTLLSALQSSLMASQQTPAAKGGSAEPEDVQQTTVTDAVMDYSFGKDGADINDAFDAFNVLNHVPVVSAMYQNETGREINAVAKLAGGYLYGGPVGLTLSALDLGLQALSGSSVNDRLASLDMGQLFDWTTSESTSPGETPQLAAYHTALPGDGNGTRVVNAGTSPVNHKGSVL